MAFEERVLRFNGFRVTLAYNEDGIVNILIIEHDNGERIAILSKSQPAYIEKIYELLRECEVTW